MLSEASYHNMTVGRIPSVEGGIQPTIVDAKGDLIAAVAADSLNRLAVGSNDQVLVADSTASTGLAWKSYGAQVVAGKNAIINGTFDVWQRGTSFTAGNAYTADRWYLTGTVSAVTISRETTTVAPGSLYSLKIAPTGTAGVVNMHQAIETLNAIRFAGQTVTLSVDAAATASTTISTQLYHSSSTDNPMGGSWTQITATSGGSGTVSTSTFSNISGVYAVPSTAKSLLVLIVSSGPSGQSAFLDNVQLELGGTRTPFSRAGGTIQGELAACQRYYYRFGGNNAYQYFGAGSFISSTVGYVLVKNPITMRANPTAVEFSTLEVYDFASGIAVTNVTNSSATTDTQLLAFTIASGGTQYRPCLISTRNSTSGYLALTAEL
jgi:hypothetical protein